MRPRGALTAFANIVELRTKIISMTTFLSALLYVEVRHGAYPPLLAILMGAAVLCVDMGTTAFNSFFDYLRGVDHRAHTREPDKVLVKGEVPPAAALLISGALYFAAACLGIAIALMTGVEVVAAGALCMAVGFLYNAGPLPLSSTPLGELFAGGFLGSALFLITYYVGSGVLSLHGFLISLPFTLYIASILTVNNSCDLEGDRSAGRKTIVVLCGPMCGRLIIYSAGAGAYALLIAYAAAGLFPETLYYTAPPALLLAVREYVRMERRGYSHATKGANMNAIVRLFALFGMAVMAALLLALV